LLQWREHRVKISDANVHEIVELSSTGDDRNPWISDDGKRIYFSRETGAATGSDIYLALRVSPTSQFTPPLPVANLNSGKREGRPSLTADETILVLSTDRDGPINIELTDTSSGPLGVPGVVHLAEVNKIGTERIDPFLTADGLHLYFGSDTGPSSKLQLLVATRSSTTDDFAPPINVPGIGDNAVNQTDPALSRDELVLVYSAYHNNEAGELWYATRTTSTGNFGMPAQVPGVSTDASEFDPVLSPDGCELYFASNRNGKYHLFHAQVTR
jgi:Tol biopolymer transport system component